MPKPRLLRPKFLLLLVLPLTLAASCEGEKLSDWIKSSQPASAQSNLYPAGQLPPPPPQSTAPARGGERPQPSDLVPRTTAPYPAAAPVATPEQQPQPSLLSYLQPSPTVPPPYQPSAQLEEYNQGGGVSMKTARRLIDGEFAKRQSQRAMRSLLGYPNWIGETSEVYRIRGTGDRVMADRKLVILYDFQTNEAIGWYIS
jgi:hypothetical protein